MSSLGIDRGTGEILTGWEHVRQSIWTILTTELGSRVERRDFGVVIEGLIDRPQNEETVVDFVITVAEALEPREFEGRFLGEPRFQMTDMQFDLATPGRVELVVSGVYYPNGHLGDFSVSEDMSGRIVLR